MKSLCALVFLIISTSLRAQTPLPRQHVQLSVGRAIHGTGDLRGLAYDLDYAHYFRKRVSWSVALGGSIHDGSLPLYYSINNESVDASYRYTVAGFQLAGYAGYSLVRTNRHELQIKLGALLRYQSSSYFDGIAVLYPAATGYPIPLMAIYNRTPQRTYTVGGSSKLAYNYTIRNSVSLGAHGGLQTDSNGDTIIEFGLSIGKRF